MHDTRHTRGTGIPNGVLFRHSMHGEVHKHIYRTRRSWPSETSTRLCGFAEPSRRSLSKLLIFGDVVTGPCDEAIGAHQHGAHAQPILDVTRDIIDPTTPAACKRLKRCAGVEVQQYPFRRPEA